MRSKHLIHKDEIIRLYFESKMSLPDVSKQLSIPISSVRHIIISHGYNLRTKNQGIDLARHKLGKHLLGKKRNFTNEHCAAIASAKKYGYESVSLKPSGYLEVTTQDNKGRPSHRVIMEQYLGRDLRENEIVHHIDHDKTNNHIDNLCLLTKKGHSRLHRFEDLISGYKIKRDSKGRIAKKGE